MKNMRKISSSSGSLFEKNPKVFELLLFFSNSLEDLVRKSEITGALAETVGIYSVVHPSLSDPSGSVLSRLSTLVHSHSSQQRSNESV